MMEKNFCRVNDPSEVNFTMQFGNGQTRQLSNICADLIAEINEIKNYKPKANAIGIIQLNPHFDIVNYTYEDEIRYDSKGNKTVYKKTTLTFRDNTSTSVSAPADKADPYTGFYTCYAKHCAGGKNIINDLADYWIDILPKKLAKEQADEQACRDEEARLAERDKKRREKQRVRLEAIRRKEAYDASVLAHEKYGVPMEFIYKNENK